MGRQRAREIKCSMVYARATQSIGAGRGMQPEVNSRRKEDYKNEALSRIAALAGSTVDATAIS